MPKDGLDKDSRVVDSRGALALKEVPKRMLILGGIIIGLEMGTVYSTLGARLDVVEMMDGLMQGADRPRPLANPLAWRLHGCASGAEVILKSR
jgi:pyruvate/2-oxoglutarate dehydrogenase complex dihydrolipoamide dehydrogenase (E3) component